MKFIFHLIFLSILTQGLQAQNSHQSLLMADRLYIDSNYSEAEEFYRTAAIQDPSAQAKFNLGNTLFEQERYEEAAKEYQQAMNLSNDTIFRSKALYNKGNSLLQKGDLKESLNAYKKSLLLNPADEDTKRNFMYAMQQQQMQEQQQKQEKNNEKSEDQENQEQQNQEQQEGENPPPPGDENEQNEGQEEQPQDEDQPQNKEPSENEKKDMDREEAEQLLKIIEKTDSHVQKKLKKQNSTKKQGDKNW